MGRAPSVSNDNICWRVASNPCRANINGPTPRRKPTQPPELYRVWTPVFEVPLTTTAVLGAFLQSPMFLAELEGVQPVVGQWATGRDPGDAGLPGGTGWG